MVMTLLLLAPTASKNLVDGHGLATLPHALERLPALEKLSVWLPSRSFTN